MRRRRRGLVPSLILWRESDTPSIRLHTPSSLDSLFSSPSPDRLQSPISTTRVLSKRRTSRSIPSSRSRLPSMCSFTSSWILSSSEMILSFVFPVGCDGGRWLNRSVGRGKVLGFSELRPFSAKGINPSGTLVRRLVCWDTANRWDFSEGFHLTQLVV